ncbi:MAG: aspartate-semialdehyde dehydrogenase [Vibrionaceae bacterium]
MMMQYQLAILGASGTVGRAIIELLEEQDFAAQSLHLLGSESAGEVVRVQGQSVRIQDAAQFDWHQVQVAIFCVDAAVSAQYASLAAEAGVVIIDISSAYRLDPDVPLVLPMVNEEALADFRNKNIIAIADPLVMQMSRVLKPIHDAVGVSRVNVSTYQAVASQGKKGVDELASQTIALLNSQSVACEVFPKQIAFNCLAQTSALFENGYTQSEMALVWESQRIFGQEIAVNPTCVQIPVFYGNGQALHLECHNPIDAEQIMAILQQTAGVMLFEPAEYPAPVPDASEQEAVCVGRVRNDISHPQGINLWLMADSAKLTAHSTLQVLNCLIRDYF